MKSYITTPIYYINGDPHIGHANTTIMADIIRRGREFYGMDTYLQTGCDEHGQKNADMARQLDMNNADYADMRSASFADLFNRLDIGYTNFARTSSLHHACCVQDFAMALYRRGAIVKKPYTGLYCRGCEQFRLSSDLRDDQCPDHPSLKIETIEEINYFLRLEPYRQELIEWVEGHPDFIQPETYRSELLEMLRQPLEDMCISRPKTRVSLGIELPFDSDYVAYVWFDALINYISQHDAGAQIPGWWPNVEHFIGKDIIKPHGVYWPIMLMALGVEPPAKLTVHGMLVGPGGLKMSKTAGNGINPDDVIGTVGVDGLRYYLAKNIRPYGGDTQVSMDMIVQTYNADLANKIGNLITRTAGLIKRRFGNVIPDLNGSMSSDEFNMLKDVRKAAGTWWDKPVNLHDIPGIIEQLIKSADQANRYIADKAPWKIDNDDQAGHVCRVTLSAAILIMIGLIPVMPNIKHVLEKIGAKTPMPCISPSVFNLVKENHILDETIVPFKKVVI